jgi:uncharacterized protein (DUF433 family)
MRYDERMKVRDETFDRVTVDPRVMGGRPCIRGMRITVSNIVGQLAAGATQDELLSEYPYLERADIEQALAFAAALAAQPIAAE